MELRGSDLGRLLLVGRGWRMLFRAQQSDKHWLRIGRGAVDLIVRGGVPSISRDAAHRKERRPYPSEPPRQCASVQVFFKAAALLGNAAKDKSKTVGF